MTFTIWANHEKVNRGWLPILTGLTGTEAAHELTTRQDRVRRTKQPCRFKALPDGETP